MSKKTREFLWDNKGVAEAMEALRKECENKDLPGLLAMVEVSEALLAAIRFLIIAEIARARGLLGQTKRGNLKGML